MWVMYMQAFRLKGSTYLSMDTLADPDDVISCRRIALVGQSSLSYSSMTNRDSV